MRDNGTKSNGNGGAQIKPASWIRTEWQVSLAEGFAPGFIEPREPVELRTDGEYTPQMAKPPAWTHRDDLPCTSRVPKGNQPDPYDTTDEFKAKALCAGCPVKRECLMDALEFEGDLVARSRWLIRGGKTPEQRATLSKYLLPGGAERP